MAGPDPSAWAAAAVAGQISCWTAMASAPLPATFVPPAAAWFVSYVDQVRQDGSGKVVPLRGGARLQILTNRPDDVTTGKATYRPANPGSVNCGRRAGQVL